MVCIFSTLSTKSEMADGWPLSRIRIRIIWVPQLFLDMYLVLFNANFDSFLNLGYFIFFDVNTGFSLDFAFKNFTCMCVCIFVFDEDNSIG